LNDDPRPTLVLLADPPRGPFHLSREQIALCVREVRRLTGDPPLPLEPPRAPRRGTFPRAEPPRQS
jgi:hypothetical protein